MTHIAEALPQTPEEVTAKMIEMGIDENAFSAEVFFHHYNARNWLLRGEKIVRWSSLLICWQKYAENKNGKRQSSKHSTSSASASCAIDNTSTVTEALPLGGSRGGLDPRAAEVSSWLDCQYPMPEEPELREKAEKLERCYSLEHQPEFGKYEHLKEILTSNTITLEAAARTIDRGIVERIIIRHIDELAAHFDTTLLTYSLAEMQQTARWMIDKAGWLKLSELMLICQRAKEENQLPHNRICRGDIKELIRTFPEWKSNTLQYLK